MKNAKITALIPMGFSQRISAIFVILLLSIPFASAANLYGLVYDLDLNIVKEAQISIDTVPLQKQITKEGGYSFEVSPGVYTLTAEHYKNGALDSSTKEKVIIERGGSYIYDIILFPLVSEDIEIEEELSSNLFGGDRSWKDFVLIVIFLLFVGIIAYLFQKRKKQPESIGQLDAELLKLLACIRKEGGRTTQKDIRKTFPYSEAKISLMLTELEDKGLLKRIKKGRGNIILLQKKN